MALNVVVLMGRLVKDPEMRTTNSGKSVCQFTIAVDRGGEGADFVDCTAWQKTGDFVHQYFNKGSMIAVNGRLQIDSYEDKEGKRRNRTQVVCQNVSFCGKKESNSDTKPTTWNPAGFETVSDNEDLPF